MKIDLNSPGLKKGMGVVSALFMGIVAVATALSDQQKDREFEEMKKTLAELQNKGDS